MGLHDSFSNYRQQYPDGDMENNTWGGRLTRLAEAIPHRTAFIQGARELTWRQFERRVNRLSNALLDLGVVKEDRIAIMGFNSLEWMESYFASSRIGAVPVNVNPRFIPAELRYILEDSDAKVLILEPDGIERIQEVRKDLASLKHIIVIPGPAPQGMLAYEDLIQKYDPSRPRLDWPVTNSDFAFLFYTGGTTGFPKGTVWDGQSRIKGLDTMALSSLQHIIAGIRKLPDEVFPALRSAMPFFPPAWMVKNRFLDRLDSTDVQNDFLDGISLRLFGSKFMYTLVGGRSRVLIVAPLFHGAAYDTNFGLMGATGATSIYLAHSHPLDPAVVWRTLEEKKANVMLIVGDAFAIPLLEEMETGKYNTRSLSMIISSGVVWSPRIKKRFLNRIPNLLIMDHLGTTESSTAFSHMSSGADQEIASLKIRPAEKGIHISRVFNMQTMQPAKPGERGELAYGGVTALGYWKDPEKTARSWKVIEERRWFFVGDQGTLDQEGNFIFQGRGPTVINTGGEKVYPEEVEDIIKDHRAVRECAVTGIPDERWGEAVTALVVPVDGGAVTEEDIIEFCRQRMAGYKKPRHVLFVRELPVSPSGKLERRNLKELAIRTLAEKAV